MSAVKICGGDWAGTGQFKASLLQLPSPDQSGAYEVMEANDVVEIAIAAEDRYRLLDGAFGTVLGAFACKFLGKNGIMVTFVAKFRDGRSLFARVDEVTFAQIRASYAH